MPTQTDFSVVGESRGCQLSIRSLCSALCIFQLYRYSIVDSLIYWAFDID